MPSPASGEGQSMLCHGEFISASRRLEIFLQFLKKKKNAPIFVKTHFFSPNFSKLNFSPKISKIHFKRQFFKIVIHYVKGEYWFCKLSVIFFSVSKAIL